MRKCVICIIIFFIVPVMVAAAFFLKFKYSPILPVGRPAIMLCMPAGSGAGYLLRLLERRALEQDFFSKIFVRCWTRDQSLKQGVYEVKPGESFFDLVYKILHGRVAMHAFVIIEGWRYSFLIDALQKKSDLVQDVKTEIKNDLEGELFPDTYFYVPGDTEEDILQRAFIKMQQVLGDAWQGRQEGLPYKTPYEALIVASMIEKETAAPEERPLIASVIINRLQKHMLLQIDSTVIYGLGNLYHGVLTHVDLKQDTPYNTYIHMGLPPTPISFPGRASIEAALHPASSPYLYYVVKLAGHHQFSENYQQHLQAVMEYARKKNVDFLLTWCDGGAFLCKKNPLISYP